MCVGGALAATGILFAAKAPPTLVLVEGFW